VPVPLHATELPAIVRRFADAAQRLERCGWDGCEVTSLGGHLIEQFFDPAVNDRSDRYGGSLENRTRFGRDVLDGVRAAVSDRFLLSFRMTVDQCLTGGLGPTELIEIARSFAAPGAIDLLSLSGGTGATRLTTAYAMPGDELGEGVFNESALRFRLALDMPVLVAGRNLEPSMANACVERGIDLVAMTRAIIADPDLPAKARRGAQPRPCIGLNEGCIGRLYSGLPMWCSVNPAIREPDLDNLIPAARPGRVIVVGGGVAGLEAARGAALRGHSVVLLERRGVLGGRARLAGRRRGRERWARYVAWLEDEVTAAGAEIRLGAHATAALVMAQEPDTVILATGSELRPSAMPRGPVPVMDVDELLEHGVPGVERQSALVLDDEGSFLAPTAADALVDAGFAVEIATSHPAICTLIDPTQQPFVLRRLALAGVTAIRLGVAVTSDSDGVTLRNIYTERDERRCGIGLMIVAGHRRAQAALGRDLAAARAGFNVVAVGDGLAPRTLLDAVAEGARAGASV
jgi:dimethylglycine catabolism A